MINGLTDVFTKVLQARTLDASLYQDVISALQSAFPDENFGESGPLADRHPTEAVLHLVNTHLPGWSIVLKGTARDVDGEWTCTLRQSDRQDNDEMLGNGAGPTLALAMLIAFLKLSVFRASR